MKNIMFGINIIVLICSFVMAALFVAGHILGGEGGIDQFTGFLAALASGAYSGFNAMAIYPKD